MSAEVYISNMRGTAVTVGKCTHVLLQLNWRPRWSDELHPEAKTPTLGCGLLGLLAFEEITRSGRKG